MPTQPKPPDIISQPTIQNNLLHFSWLSYFAFGQRTSAATSLLISLTKILNAFNATLTITYPINDGDFEHFHSTYFEPEALLESSS